MKKSLYNQFIVITYTLYTAGLAYGQGGSSQFRFMSMSIRDTVPSYEEVLDYRNGVKGLQQFRDEWIASDEHKLRIKRYFRDMFGVSEQIFLFDSPYYLVETDDGVLYSAEKGLCAGSQVVTSTAWWLEAGESIRVCSNIVKDALFVLDENNEQFGCTWGAASFAHAECGCGPDMILCLPAELRPLQLEAVRDEFANRALYGYEQNLTWSEVLGGQFFYGNRYLFQYYLYSEPIVSLSMPEDSELALMKSISVDDMERVDFPTTRIERAGVATSPGFMKQFNNYRSRIRALTQRLLCQDIDGSLNTDGISTFKNEGFSEVDLTHGSRAGCAECHYPMDNMGSTLFGWDDLGFYRHWLNLNQLGHVFGVEGTGPEFLMSGFIERGSGFIECMARTAWESFAGITWANLPAISREAFAQQAERGPRTTITSILLSELYFGLKTTGIQVDPLSQSSNEVSFDDYINPVILQSCSGNSCHSSDSSLGTRYQYVYSADNFAEAPVARFSDGTMPPASSGKSISDTDRQLLINYLSR